MIGPPGVPTVLIGGMPAATVGTPHICSFPPPAVHPPTRDRAAGLDHRADRRHARGADGRHGRLRRPDHHGRPDRDDRRLSDGAQRRLHRRRAGRSRCAPTPPAASRWSPGEREIEEAIRLILGTAPGERPMRPEFGCRVHDHVFAPVNAVHRRADRARRAVGAGAVGAADRRATTCWSASTAPTPAASTSTSTTRSAGVNDPRNLVFPFYVIPDESTELPAASPPSATAALRSGRLSGTREPAE